MEEESSKVGLFVNPDMYKVMTTSTWYDRMDIQAAGIDLEAVSDFCYFGSYISYKGSCEKDVTVRTGKAAAVFGKMRGVWKSSKISLRVKVRLYESVTLSTFLYSAESWPLTATSLKQLDGAHHRWQKSILTVSWKNKITNQEVRARIKQHSIASTHDERRLRWPGRVLRMDHQHILQQALHWEVQGFKRGPGRSRTNWRGVVKKDLQKWDSPGRRQRWQLSTDQNGVGV